MSLTNARLGCALALTLLGAHAEADVPISGKFYRLCVRICSGPSIHATRASRA